MTPIDETHDPARRCWVPSADGHADFPVQNLPFGVFSTAIGGARGGVAIGDDILDLAVLAKSGLLSGPAQGAAETAAAGSLNDYAALPAAARLALRRALSDLLSADSPPALEDLLQSQAECQMHLPMRIGDYTDFYAGIHHAVKAGQVFRPGGSLFPNYKYVPIGYHGRASTVRASGGEVRRPSGQSLPSQEARPAYGPTAALDYEVEVAIWIGSGNAADEPIPIAEADRHIAGFGLLNDWSARDFQRWEAQPLGPFLSKSFATSVSPWMITPEALAPFRTAQPCRPAGDPMPLPHLSDPIDQAEGNLKLTISAFIQTEAMRRNNVPPHQISRSSMLDLYWTPAQLVTHHASNGCALSPGDLFGTGTISGQGREGGGCLLEVTEGGRVSIALPGGETRTYLQDGDEIIFIGRFEACGYVSIGTGANRGRIAGRR